MSKKVYPDSRIELNAPIAKHYDSIMNLVTLGRYNSFINRAVRQIDIEPEDRILDLGCGTGRNAELMLDYLGDKGFITGIDISAQMEKQFRTRFWNNKQVEFINHRIDTPFSLENLYDKVLISFVIHGFPHEIRLKIIRNACDHLKPGGSLHILDYNEFDMHKMPDHHRFIFKLVECRYAFDFLEHDWKKILGLHGFGNFSENLFYNNYVRLLKAVKV
jgi:ubiquinone/menaquinone biosynthesis C-methylase UbiE